MESDTSQYQNFDPNFAAELLVDIAQERSLESMLEKFICVALARPANARVEIWIIKKGIPGASEKSAASDQTPRLRLVASGSNPLSGKGGETSISCNSETSIPLGVGVIGKIAAVGEQTVLNDLDSQPGEFSDLDWMRREQIRAFAGTAILFKGEILGVVAVFGRMNMPEKARAWRQIFADHIGSAVANARAFKEIQRLQAQLEMQNAYLEEEVVEAKAFGDLIGQSAPLRHIVSQIDLVAPTDASVLILGETGTGKELVAREIHYRSHRKDRPLIRVNCGSIPNELYESEFFGHARGAFTGAIKDRAGRFETAEGGTIFLDEIAEIPLELQSKLLRVLQDKRYERVGEDRTRSADVRIVGATNRDLKKEVKAGRFREDLYYRLNVFPIHIAPLRERTDDIAPLAQHFIELSVKELRCPKPRITRAAVAKLQNYDWPGNIRELRNVIERAVILTRGGTLDFDLPTTDAPATMPRFVLKEANGQEGDILTEAEKKRRDHENLLAALRKSNWKIKGAGGAAELLGLKPTTLLTRMKKAGLKRAT